MILEEARKEINEIDKEIVKLLEKRFCTVLKVGQYKKENNLPVLDEKREARVIENCIDNLEDKIFSKQVEDIYRQVMNSCKELE